MYSIKLYVYIKTQLSVTWNSKHTRTHATCSEITRTPGYSPNAVYRSLPITGQQAPTVAGKGGRDGVY